MNIYVGMFSKFVDLKHKNPGSKRNKLNSFILIMMTKIKTYVRVMGPFLLPVY